MMDGAVPMLQVNDADRSESTGYAELDCMACCRPMV
jgi:hypothetical protein